MNIAEEVAEIMLKIGGITLNPKKPYRFTSGILSPIYTDCRLLISYPKERRIIRDYYVHAIKSLNKKVDLIAATVTAGVPHGAWIADSLQSPMVYVRGKAKEYGKGNQIEGLTKKGQHAVIIEDHISTGKSSIETAVALRSAGVKVDYIFSITTYELKIVDENFKKNKLKLKNLTNFKAVVDVASKLGYIKPDEKEIVLEWAKDPQKWGKKMGFE